MIETLVGADLIQALKRAGLGVGGPKHNAPYSRIHQRTGAHEARLEGHIERAIGEPPVPDNGRGITKSEDFGVSGRITRQFALVMAPSDYLAIADDNRSNRDIIVRQRRTRLGEREAHHLGVDLAGWHVGNVSVGRVW